MLVAALGAMNALLSLALSYALRHSHPNTVIGLLLLLLPLWSLWGSSAVSWIRGVTPHRDVDLASSSHQLGEKSRLEPRDRAAKRTGRRSRG